MKSVLALALSLGVLCVGVIGFNLVTAQATAVGDTASKETQTGFLGAAESAASTESGAFGAQSGSASSSPEQIDAQIEWDGTTYQLTGLPAEDTTWRPVAVTVNTSAVTSMGMSSAAVVYEVLAQGHETSMSMLFNNIWEMPVAGPVDQASDILWQFAMPQNAVLVQSGWNIYAENLLNCYAYQPIDAMIEGTTAFTFNNGDGTLAGEHSWYASSVEAYQALEGYGVSAEGASAPLFQFAENTTATEAAESLWVQYSASAGSFFGYDAASERWLLTTTATGAKIDANNGATVGFDNVFLLSADASVKDDGYTREYDLTEGTGLYLTKGTWQPITWYKGDVTDSLVVLDERGKQLVVNPGTSYIGVFGGFSGQMLTLTAASGSYDASILSGS